MLVIYRPHGVLIPPFPYCYRYENSTSRTGAVLHRVNTMKIIVTRRDGPLAVELLADCIVHGRYSNTLLTRHENNTRTASGSLACVQRSPARSFGLDSFLPSFFHCLTVF